MWLSLPILFVRTELDVSKVLKCGDLMPGRAFEVRAATEEEVPVAAAAHAKNAHGLK